MRRASFQDALAAMGVSAQQLAADIQANPQAALTEFLRTLEQVDKASRAEILSRLFGAEYQDDVARLLGGLNQYEQALARVGDASQTAGAGVLGAMTRLVLSPARRRLLVPVLAHGFGHLEKGFAVFGCLKKGVAVFGYGEKAGHLRARFGGGLRVGGEVFFYRSQFFQPFHNPLRLLGGAGWHFFAVAVDDGGGAGQVQAAV